MLIELAQAIGLQPKRTSSTSVGEFHSPCPGCGGKDRFAIWPKTNRYWCRQCQKSGDAIQFCKDFMGMTYGAACEKVGVTPQTSSRSFTMPIMQEFAPLIVTEPTEAWCQKAWEFIQNSHEHLRSNPHLLNLEKDRGLSEQTIDTFKLGWNASEKFELRESWGLNSIEDGKKSKKLCLPEGVVIPSFRANKPSQIKMRRHKWSSEDLYSPYAAKN